MTWRIIPGYTHYIVSDHGMVKRLAHTYTDKAGRKYTRKEQILAQRKNGKTGYLQVNLRNAQRTNITHYVHRLVLLAFSGDPCPGQECLHKDGNKYNNVLSNLRWGTRIENMEDRTRHGRQGRAYGVRNANSKFTEEDILKLLHMFHVENAPRKLICERFGIRRQRLYEIASGKAWPHVYNRWKQRP